MLRTDLTGTSPAMGDLPQLVDTLPTAPSWRIAPDLTTPLGAVNSVPPVVGQGAAATASPYPTVVDAGGVYALSIESAALYASVPAAPSLVVVGRLVDSAVTGAQIMTAWGALLSQGVRGAKAPQIWTSGGAIGHTTVDATAAGGFVWSMSLSGTLTTSRFNSSKVTGTIAAPSGSSLKIGPGPKLQIFEVAVFPVQLADSDHAALCRHYAARYGLTI